MKFNIPKINLDNEKLKALTKKLFQDKFEKILQDLLELEKENPTDVRVKQKIAEIYYKKDRIPEAIEKFQEIAKHYEKEDFILKAIKACQSILKIRPELVEYNLKLGSLFLKIGMTNEAANQYRIAINYYASLDDVEKTLSLSQTLVKIDPSPDNRAKLAEIYQSHGMTEEAIKQYDILAKTYRKEKNFDKLLHYYELILPHKKEDHAIIRDVCILHLRNKRPERALKLMEHYQVLENENFAELQKKARLMMEALKKGR